MHQVTVSSPHPRCDQQDQRVLLITARSSALPPASGPVMQARQHSLTLNKSVSLVGSHAGRGEARRLHARPAAQHHSGTQAARGTHSHQRPSYTRHEGRTQSHHALGLHVPMDANTKHKTGMGGWATKSDRAILHRHEGKPMPPHSAGRPTGEGFACTR